MKKIAVIALSALMLAGTGFAAKVDQRQADQNARIKQGVASGELTHKEAKHLRKREKAVHRKIKSERKANGGKLTKAERRRINRQQNRTSHKIYRKKHNEAVRPDSPAAK